VGVVVIVVIWWTDIGWFGAAGVAKKREMDDELWNHGSGG